MMQNNEKNKKNNETPSLLSYVAVKEQLMMQASSLLDDRTIESMLEEEKVKFDNAARLGLSPSVFIGMNTLRYCKDTIRKKQPFSFLYFFFNRLTELSIGLVLCCLLAELAKHIAPGSFFTHLSHPYILWSILLIVLFWAHKKSSMANMLSIPLSKKSYKEKMQYKKKMLHRKQFLFAGYLLLFLLSNVCILYFAPIDLKLSIGLLPAFWFYIGCMVLSGIHNTLYSSHFLPFLGVGACLLTRRSKEQTKQFMDQYQNASYLQILTTHQKTEADFKKEDILRTQVKKELYSRLVTQRVYYALALFLFAVLDLLCIWQLKSAFTLPFGIFLICSLLVTILFLIAWAAANHILKDIKQSATF